MWAYAVNITLSKDPPGAVDDGFELTRIIIEEIGQNGFQGMSGGIYINENGDNSYTFE